MTVAAPGPADPSRGNTSFAQRRAARLAREAKHGVAPRPRKLLRAGNQAENDITIDSTGSSA